MSMPAVCSPVAPFSNPQLSLIRKTCVPKVTTDSEFDWFIEICKITRLNPLTKQIYLFIFNANKPDKRQFVPVTSIGGFRSIAARSGNYRPDSRAPRFEYDDSLKDDAINPLGMVRAEVSVFQHSHGEWHEIVGEAYYDEYAPIKEQWADDENGKARKTGKRILDPGKDGWRKPRIMLPKCAEAQALRRGWPEDLSVIYVQEEADKMHTIDLTATEIVANEEEKTRLNRIGRLGRTIMIDLGTEVIEPVPVGQFADKCLAFIKEKEAMPAIIESWRTRNRHALREFHALDKAAAFEIKKHIDDVLESAQAKAEADKAHGDAA